MTKNLETNWAYIAGFFDGDGCVSVQLKNRHDTLKGWRIMISLHFYQDKSHKEPLEWMKSLFGIGYLHDRNDGISELKVDGYRNANYILKRIRPYVRFKKKQVELALRMLKILEKEKFLSLTRDIRAGLAENIIDLRNANYRSHQRKWTDDQIREILTR